jgi:hypothetical protein
MDDDERRAAQEELVRELVKVMGSKPRTPHEQERRIQRMVELQAMIDELRHAGDRQGQARYADKCCRFGGSRHKTPTGGEGERSVELLKNL